AAGDAAAGVAGGLGEVVGLLVDDDAAAEDGVLAGDGGGGEGDLRHGHALGIGLEVAHVAGVGVGVTGLAVLVLVGVEVTAGAHGLFHVGAVAELVDVKAVLGVGGEAGDVGGDLHAAAGVGELDDAVDLLVAGGAVDHGDG